MGWHYTSCGCDICPQCGWRTCEADATASQDVDANPSIETPGELATSRGFQPVTTRNVIVLAYSALPCGTIIYAGLAGDRAFRRATLQCACTRLLMLFAGCATTACTLADEHQCLARARSRLSQQHLFHVRHLFVRAARIGRTAVEPNVSIMLPSLPASAGATTPAAAALVHTTLPQLRILSECSGLRPAFVVHAVHILPANGAVYWRGESAAQLASEVGGKDVQHMARPAASWAWRSFGTVGPNAEQRSDVAAIYVNSCASAATVEAP